MFVANVKAISGLPKSVSTRFRNCPPISPVPTWFLVTLVILVVLSILGYTLSSRLAAQHHRQQYIIDYQVARYGCDSASRYIFAALQDINTTQLVDRPNEPDFSDLFTLSEVGYREFLAKWAAEGKVYSKTKSSDVGRDINDINDVNDVNGVGEANNTSGVIDFNAPNSLIVRGPDGPPGTCRAMAGSARRASAVLPAFHGPVR